MAQDKSLKIEIAKHVRSCIQSIDTRISKANFLATVWGGVWRKKICPCANVCDVFLSINY